MMTFVSIARRILRRGLEMGDIQLDYDWAAGYR